MSFRRCLFSYFDTQYDVIMWYKQKNGPRAAQATGSLMFLQHYDVYRVSIMYLCVGKMLSTCFI